VSTICRLPYRTPKPERLTLGSWSMHIDEDVQPFLSFLAHWDPAVTITTIIPAQVDSRGVSADCGLDSDAQLRLAVLWNSPGTMLCGRGEVFDFDCYESVNYLLHISVEGTLIAQMVNFTVQLLLLSPGRSTQPFAPIQPGSILVSQTQTIRLEGEGSRFPVEVIDFGPTPYASGAGWALYWDEDDLHQTLLGSARLYINRRHEAVVRAVSRHRQENDGIWEAIRFDIARTLIYRSLQNDDFINHPYSFALGSVGAVVRDLLCRCFPQMTMRQCREHTRHRLIFETQLQAALHLFGEV